MLSLPDKHEASARVGTASRANPGGRPPDEAHGIILYMFNFIKYLYGFELIFVKRLVLGFYVALSAFAH